MNKETNEQLYRELMRFRANDPKRYVLIRIREKYDIISSRIDKHGKDDVVRCLVNDLNEFIKTRCPIYRVSKNELIEYFRNNGMSLTF